MTDKWKRDPAFDYDRFITTGPEAIDREIEQIQQKRGYFERLLARFTSPKSQSRKDDEAQASCYAEQALPGSDFTRQKLVNADFRNADLKQSVFTGALLNGAMFCDADLREANLAEAVLTGADLRGANLSGANLIGADFSGADLRGANLQGSYLWGADFHDTDLLDALLDGAYAGGSIFSHARNLTLEQFRSTIHDETGAYRLSMLPDQPKKHDP